MSCSLDAVGPFDSASNIRDNTLLGRITRLQGGSGTFADAAKSATIFKMALSDLMKFTKHRQILGTISGLHGE
jgi:hypothetical protein